MNYSVVSLIGIESCNSCSYHGGPQGEARAEVQRVEHGEPAAEAREAPERQRAAELEAVEDGHGRAGPYEGPDAQRGPEREAVQHAQPRPVPCKSLS